MDTIESTTDDIEQSVLVVADSGAYDDGSSGSYDDGSSGTFDDGSSGDGGSGGDGDVGSGDGGSDGPGVRTPGFWSQTKWQDFWDGDPSVPKQAGDPGFAEGDILLSSGTTDGLLIGDYDLDGVTDADENTIFLSLDDARAILNASQTEAQDMQLVLARDVVATWLNFLAGNAIADADPATMDPQDYLDEAIAWLKFTTGSGNPIDSSVTLASSAEWNAGIDSDSDGTADILAGSFIHSQLDEYNNTGTIDGVFYAQDADSIL